jgi:hypothetical protein
MDDEPTQELYLALLAASQQLLQIKLAETQLEE